MQRIVPDIPRIWDENDEWFLRGIPYSNGHIFQLLIWIRDLASPVLPEDQLHPQQDGLQMNDEKYED